MGPDRIKITHNCFLLYVHLVCYIVFKKNKISTTELDKVLEDFAKDIIESRYGNEQEKERDLYVTLKDNCSKTSLEIMDGLWSRVHHISQIKRGHDDFNKLFGLNKTQNGQSSAVYRTFDEYVNKYCSSNKYVTLSKKAFFTKYLEQFFKSVQTELSVDFASKNSASGIDTNNAVIDNGGTRANTESAIADTIWYLYYHEYNPQTSPYTIISRFVLHIIDKNHIVLYDKSEGLDFEVAKPAEVVVSSTPILIIYLKRYRTEQQKNLELRFVISQPVASDSVFLGQYMDFESGDILVSGTVVLQHVTGANERIEPRGLHDRACNFVRPISIKEANYYVVQTKLGYYTDWQRYVPQPIAVYLSDKWKNFTKTKGLAVYNLQTLANNFNLEQDHKRYHISKYNAIIEYDAMLIVPMFDEEKKDDELFERINNTFFKEANPIIDKEHKDLSPLYETNDELKEIDIHRIYFPQRVFKLKNPRAKGYKGRDSSLKILKLHLSVLKQSRALILILPDAILSSAMIFTGAAIAMEKKVFVYSEKEIKLPRVISNTHEPYIEVAMPMPIEDIPAHLEDQGGDYLDREK